MGAPISGASVTLVSGADNGGDEDNTSALSITFTDNSGVYGSYTDMLTGDYAYDSSLDAYRNAGSSASFGVIKWFDSPSNWNNGSDNGGAGAGWYLCSYNSNNTVKDMFYNLKGTSGDISSLTAGSYTGNYTMFADSSYTFSFTISLSGSSSGGGDTPSVTYLYTVSGSSRAEVNGDYWQDGTMNGKGKYTNGSCDMVWIGSYWAIGPIGYNGSGAPYHSCWEDIATPISSSWSGVTVTEYAGN